MKRLLFVLLFYTACSSPARSTRKAYVCGVEYMNGSEGVVAFISDTEPELIDGCLRHGDSVEVCGVRVFNVTTIPLKQPE